MQVWWRCTFCLIKKSGGAAVSSTLPHAKDFPAVNSCSNSCSSACSLTCCQWSVHRGGTEEDLYSVTSDQHFSYYTGCMVACEYIGYVKIKLKKDLPDINCWVVRWEESPDCGAAERIPSLTWGNSTSKSPCGAQTDAADAQMKWFQLLNTLQSGASCVFFTPSGLSMLTAACEIITL